MAGNSDEYWCLSFGRSRRLIVCVCWGGRENRVQIDGSSYCLLFRRSRRLHWQKGVERLAHNGHKVHVVDPVELVDAPGFCVSFEHKVAVGLSSRVPYESCFFVFARGRHGRTQSTMYVQRGDVLTPNVAVRCFEEFILFFSTAGFHDSIAYDFRSSSSDREVSLHGPSTFPRFECLPSAAKSGR